MEKLSSETINKIIDLKYEHHYRYKSVRKSYKIEHLYDDLEFVLNHLHIEENGNKNK